MRQEAKTKRGERFLSRPSVAFGLVQLDEQVLDAVGADGTNHRVHHRRVEAFSQLEAGLTTGASLDIVREVLGAGVVEVPQVPLGVLLEGRGLPDGVHGFSVAFAHHLAVSEVEQDAGAVLHRHGHLAHPLEGGDGVVEGLNGIVQGTTHEVHIERGRVLLGEVERVHGSRHTIGADEANHPDLEGRTEGAVKRVLDGQAEGEVLTIDLGSDVREVVEGTHPRTPVGDDFLTLEDRHTLVLEEGFRGVEQGVVLEDFVAVGHSSEHLARVGAASAEEAGLLPVLREQGDLLDLVVELGGDAFVRGFVGIGVYHMCVYLGWRNVFVCMPKRLSTFSFGKLLGVADSLLTAEVSEGGVDTEHRLLVVAVRVVATLPPRALCPRKSVLGDSVDLFLGHKIIRQSLRPRWS